MLKVWKICGSVGGGGVFHVAVLLARRLNVFPVYALNVFGGGGAYAFLRGPGGNLC